MYEDLLARFHKGERRALARLLTLASRGEFVPDVALEPGAKSSRVVAVTGSAGVGKSTLVGKWIELLRRRGLSVAVLACDPQSPVSGGALLGDRFRMPSQPDDGVFIRSLAAASGHGAVAEHLPSMIRLLERFGFDVVFLETVGAGQGDTTAASLADVLVLLLQPEAGDELQWEKAGVLEIADVVVIQKADLPAAEHTEAQVKTILGLSKERTVPVLRVSARSGEGVDRAWDAIAQCPPRPARRLDDQESSNESGLKVLRKIAEEAKEYVYQRGQVPRTLRLPLVMAFDLAALGQTELGDLWPKIVHGGAVALDGEQLHGMTVQIDRNAKDVQVE